MSTSRYDWHRDTLGLPSTISAMLFGLALGSWLLGVFLIFVSLALLYQPYCFYFSKHEGFARRRHIGSNVFFVLVQIIFWGIAFALLYAFKNALAI
jgi:hypothetical protein